ncbi:MAG TPA: adenine phosphoribosyltransferase [Kiritimatiellia bacterium]|nr:adenine phosphoribosyltransferase [Kiritimatiellia bacterium]
MIEQDLKAAIRDIPDFPKPGILFKDITPILKDPELFQRTLSLFAERHRDNNLSAIAAIESRGFIFGAPVAALLGIPFIPVRKKGKLPYQTIEATYDLEYGSATLEIHRDALTSGDRVVIIDDLLATGGTAQATADLIQQLGATVVEIDFIIELSFLHGRQKLAPYPVFAPVVY